MIDVDSPQTNMSVKRELFEEAVSTNFDPQWGSAFWLRRAAERGIDGKRDLREIEDLKLLGVLTPEELASCSLDSFVPKSILANLSDYLLAQTGGTTGPGDWTLFTPSVFNELFVTPFIKAAAHTGFSRGLRWLFVGPGGPHIIARAARAIALATNSPEPFSIDFDTRWAKRLAPESFSRQRYISHLIEQCRHIFEMSEIGVLFITPPLAVALAQSLSMDQRLAIRGVHYGGMRLLPDTLARLQNEWFPNAVHLSGYGNTLLGCAPELSVAPGRTPVYFPHGQRVIYEALDDKMNPVGSGDRGRLCVTRLDPAFLLCNLLERDQTTLVDCPSDAPDGFNQPGLYDPRPVDSSTLPVVSNLY